MLNNAAPLARATGCRLEFAVPPNLVAQAERGVFREAVAGLLRHAIGQAAGGHVLVTARSQDGRSQDGRSQLGWIQVGICDDGTGAARAQQDAWLGEPVRLLERHGATVKVAPHPGQGTVVTVRLPQAMDTSAQRNVAAEPPLADR